MPRAVASARQRGRGRRTGRYWQAAAKSPIPAPFLPRSPSRPVFQDARLEPFLDQANDALVADPMFQEADQPSLADRIEESSDICVQYPVHLPAPDSNHERIHRVVPAASGPE